MVNHITNFPQFVMKELPSEKVQALVQPFQCKKEVVKEAAAYLNFSNQVVIQLIHEDYSPLDIHCLRSKMVDELIKGLVEFYSKELQNKHQISHSHFALIAAGGYGREEMSLLSDLDLLFLVEPEYAGEYQILAEKILYVLWDVKLDVGHAVRTLSETIDYMKEDQVIFTSLLDIRMIVGDDSLFCELIRKRDALLVDKKVRDEIFLAKLKERETRLKKYGDTVYLLEPHIKEGEGGLRDLQLIRWLGNVLGLRTGYKGFYKEGFINSESLSDLEFALKFFLRLRNKSHALLNRKSDQINFDAQITLAKELGFEDDDNDLGVEKFMQVYYTVATQVNQHVKTIVQKLSSHLGLSVVEPKEKIENKVLDENFEIKENKIIARHKAVFKTDLHVLMTLFLQVQITGLSIHFSTRDLIINELHRIDDLFRKDAGICVVFKRLMGQYKNLGKTLFAMHEVHFFDVFIPEFQEIRNRMQHDVYHVYTVDTHSIFAIQELSNLVHQEEYAKSFSIYKEAVLEIKRKDLLSLGLLFHDIGKGKKGDHCLIGAEIAEKIMKRLGYSDNDREIVEFLVRSHLIMSHLSQRRDLQDMHMVTEFAKAVKTQERLNMLFVLTWADIRAVNVEAWTEWKDTLLQTLYQKTSEILIHEKSTEAFMRKKVADVRKSILSRLQSKIDSDRFEEFLESISSRYIIAHRDNEIEEHFHLISKHDDSNLFLIEKEIKKDTISEILVYTYSNPRVFPLVTGVMLALGINIMTMENFALKDGHVLIKMSVQSGNKESLRAAGLVDTLKENLYDVFSGKKHVSKLIKKRKKPSFMLKKPVQQAATEVHIDNDVSAYYTVIDVLTHDRLGLVYDIVNCLVNQGCYVELSKISTKVEQVVDTLYVKDIFGQKITSKDKLEEIKRVLCDVID